ncbi:MAG: TIGR03618 family F420-dependent PPOX class oxidoreductase [Alphaproteobacteria bacterium]|nr:TIGR03618 family F420-dependent PPOX class oxidoreductase [Alphaproteobacteria bacterium]
MIGDNKKFDQFITDHRWAVITTLRKDGHPSSSWVAYARDGDTLVISTPGRTLKRKTLENDPRVTVCCTNDKAPFNFVTIEGRADIETENIVAPTKAVFANIKGFGYEEPENLEQWMEDQERVILRIHPERVSGVIRD